MTFARPGVNGVDFFDAGSYSAFAVHCPGGYSAAYVTREHGFSRFWLQQSRLKVERGFCMPELLLPKGAIVRTEFSVPLGLAPPRYSVDRNRDGAVDRVGVFKPGGTRFPQSTRC